MCKVSELTQSLMEVNPDNCGQPTVSDIPGALPLRIRPPSPASPLPLLPLPLEGIMSPVGSPDAEMPLRSLSSDLPAPGSRVINSDSLGWESAWTHFWKAANKLWQRAGWDSVWKCSLLTLTLLKPEEAVWGRKSASQVLRVSNKPSQNKRFFHFVLKSGF